MRGAPADPGSVGRALGTCSFPGLTLESGRESPGEDPQKDATGRKGEHLLPCPVHVLMRCTMVLAGCQLVLVSWPPLFDGPAV